MLVHLSQSCILLIDGAIYPVLDTREFVSGASFAHGVNQTLIVKDSPQIGQNLRIRIQRPLFYSGSRLSGDSKESQVDPGGNVLVLVGYRAALVLNCEL